MESRISLALANKLRLLFEQNDKFLTYPQGVGFDYRYLSFMKDLAQSGLSALEQLNNKADFARLLNLGVSDSPIYAPDPARFLWNTVRDVLIDADYAESGLSAAEERQLADAIAYLTDEVTDGEGTTTTVYSAAVRKYYEYKTVWEAAEMTYLDEKITVESTTGPEGERLKQAWASYREKQLRDAKDKALQDWKTLGFKLAVENNQAIQRALEPRKFLNLDGQVYLSDIELSRISDTNSVAIDFCTTFFSPHDVFDPTTPWTKISLTKEEVDTLVASAPADLKAMFPAGAADEGLVSIALEYNNVVVIRPWFHPEFFESRCWQLADHRVVSDGATPRQGSIPAYVTSMVVIRNLSITRKASAQGQPVALPIIDPRALRELAFRKAPTLDTSKLRLQSGAALRDRAVMSRAQTPSVASGAGATARAAAVTKSAAVMKGAAAMKGVAAMKGAAMTKGPAEISRSTALGDRAAMLDVLSRMQPSQRTQFIRAKYSGTTIESPPVYVPPRQAETPPPSGTVTEPYTFPGVAVLAFVCKRVPKAPNPDVGLNWG